MLFLVSVGIHSTQQLPEPLDSRDSQDRKTTVAAEGLQQGEVDLQRNIVCIVRCQDAQDHTVWVSEEGGEIEDLSIHVCTVILEVSENVIPVCF